MIISFPCLMRSDYTSFSLQSYWGYFISPSFLFKYVYCVFFSNKVISLIFWPNKVNLLHLSAKSCHFIIPSNVFRYFYYFFYILRSTSCTFSSFRYFILYLVISSYLLSHFIRFSYLFWSFYYLFLTIYVVLLLLSIYTC